MTSNGSKAMTARPGRTAAVILTAVAMFSVACAAQPATVPRLGVPLLAQPQPPGMATPKGAKGPKECPQGVHTPFDPQQSSYRPQDPMPEPKTMPEGSTIGDIVRRGYLIAGVSQNQKRFGSINPHNGEWEGFEIDIVREIAFKLFGDRGKARARFRAVNFSNQFDLLDQSKVDILANTITITCERRYNKHVLFTTDYFDAHQKVLVSKKSTYQKIEDLEGRKVCASNGTTSMGKILATENLVAVAVAEETDCLALLQQGQVDAISTDDSVLLGMIDQDPTMHMVGPPLTDEPYGLAVKCTEKDFGRCAEEDFVRFVNGVLERVREEGTWRELYLKWLKDPDADPDTEAPPPPEAKYLD